MVESHAFDHLFPARLVDSELGEIPEGWELKPLPEIIEVNPTRTLRKGDVAPYLDMANMPTRGHTPDSVIERPFGSGMRFVNGDTLVARITPCLENGKTAYVDFLKAGQVGWGSTEYIVLRPKEPLPAEFAYCLARSESFRDFAIQSMTGSSGRQRVPAASLDHILLPASPEPIARTFGRAVAPLFARASKTATESRTLAALRDTLLPKLISGELQLRARRMTTCNLP
jgi:type I restriction enzyme S subunit